MVAIAGMNPMTFLSEKNSLRRNAMQFVAQRVLDQMQIMDRNRARMIAEEVSHLFR